MMPLPGPLQSPVLLPCESPQNVSPSHSKNEKACSYASYSGICWANRQEKTTWSEFVMWNCLMRDVPNVVVIKSSDCMQNTWLVVWVSDPLRLVCWENWKFCRVILRMSRSIIKDEMGWKTSAACGSQLKLFQ